MNFELHEHLKKDCLFVSELSLSQLLLMNNERFPWLVLVPKRNEIVEIYELETNDQNRLLLEILALSKMLKEMFVADKINVANLGNIVPQLHIHIIARYKNDDAWPSPVWGFKSAIPYSEDKAKDLIQKIKSLIPQYL